MINKLFNSEVFKNISILVSGTVLAQLIPIISQVFLRRMYEPEDFGVYSVFTSLIGIFVLPFSLRYELAIVNPKEDRRSFNIVGGVFFISIFFTILSFLLLTFFKESICELINFPLAYSYWLFCLPFVLFLLSFYRTLEFWLVRKKRFKSISINKFSRRATESLVQLLFGVFKLPVGLVLGNLIGNLSNVISGIFQTFKDGSRLSHLSKDITKDVLREYREYPIFNLLPSMLNTAALFLPVIFINMLFTTKDTAQFDLTRTVLAIPSALLSVSLTQVYLERFSSNVNNRKSIKKDFHSLIMILFCISVISVLVINFFGESLFGFVFGEQWSPAGIIAELLVFKYALAFIVSPLTLLLSVLKKIKIASIWQYLYFLMIISLYYMDYRDLSDFFKTFVYVDLICYFIYFIIIYLMVVRYETKEINES